MPGRSSMAATSQRRGGCFPMRRNLSSTCQRESIPIPTPCRPLPPTCSRNCPIPRRRFGSARSPRAPMAPSATHVVCAPGTQILLPLLAALVPPGRAGVLGPTYSEHARAAALAGHAVIDVRDIDELRAVDLAVVVNPNNPDGRIITKEKLLALSDD